jgi:hypothetical protein
MPNDAQYLRVGAKYAVNFGGIFSPYKPLSFSEQLFPMKIFSIEAGANSKIH